jgi:hypothetical protein
MTAAAMKFKPLRPAADGDVCVANVCAANICVANACAANVCAGLCIRVC